MKTIFRTLGTITICAGMLWAADKPGVLAFNQDLNALIPTSATDVIAQTVFVDEITLTNEAAGSGNDAVCTITSKADGRKLFGDTIYGTGQNKSSHYVMRYTARRMPGGVSWSCTTATVNGYISYKF